MSVSLFTAPLSFFSYSAFGNMPLYYASSPTANSKHTAQQQRTTSETAYTVQFWMNVLAGQFLNKPTEMKK